MELQRKEIETLKATIQDFNGKQKIHTVLPA